jgi:hypothetical protein
MCPNLSFPKTALEPRPALPAGTIQVMFKGFKPKLSKPKPDKAQSINMNPELVIVNDSRQSQDGKPLNGQKLFENLNLSFLPRLQDFVHAFGQVMTEAGDNVDLPGYFDGDTSNPDPAHWGAYQGPLLNEIATVELAEVKSRKSGAKPTDMQTDIKRYFCRVQGCTVQHMESLLQA